jgi:outer membrane protein OmpA-like peptidoglycan-associated protein
MQPRTSRLLMLLIGAMLAGCAAQTERSGAGTGSTEAAPAPAPTAAPEPKPEPPAYQPESEGVSYIDRPLDTTPPPKPPKPAPANEPLPDFPVTKYELPPEEEVADIGAQPDESGTVSYPEESLAAAGSTVGEPTEYADEEEQIEDIGTQPDESGTVSYAEDAPGAGASTVGAPTEFTDEEEEVADIGTQPDESGTMHYPEDQRVAAANLVSQPQTYADEPAKPAPAPRNVSVSFEAEPLFSFDKAVVRDDQRAKLDELVAGLKGTAYNAVSVVGHADRIGTKVYNQKLSERRANAVKAYLVQQGIPANVIATEGRGENEPVSGDACAKKRGKSLISCLQPDRRVDVSVSAMKKAN